MDIDWFSVGNFDIWTEDHVAHWLSTHKILAPLASSFLQNGIDGKMLSELTQKPHLLAELGVTSELQSTKLLAEIKALTRVASGTCLDLHGIHILIIAFRQQRVSAALRSVTSGALAFCTTHLIVDKPWLVPYSALVFEKNSAGNNMQLGSGAFGTVYRGRFLGQLVAVKQMNVALLQQPDTLRNFVKEVSFVHDAQHPGIVRVLAATLDCRAEEGITPCIVMEFLPYTLHTVLLDPTKYALDDAKLLGLMHQLALALVYLHTQRPMVTHCDIKPENVMLTSSYEVKLVDFGMVHMHSTMQSVKRSMSKISVVGTAGYIVSPIIIMYYFY